MRLNSQNIDHQESPAWKSIARTTSCFEFIISLLQWWIRYESHKNLMWNPCDILNRGSPFDSNSWSEHSDGISHSVQELCYKYNWVWSALMPLLLVSLHWTLFHNQEPQPVSHKHIYRKPYLLSTRALSSFVVYTSPVVGSGSLVLSWRTCKQMGWRWRRKILEL